MYSFRNTQAVLARYKESYTTRCGSCHTEYTLGVRRCPDCSSRHQRIAQSPKVQVKNPGILEIPKGKTVTDLPIKHFVGLAKSKGAAAIQRALSNLIRWMGPGSKNPNPKVVEHAKKAREAIRTQVTEKANARQATDYRDPESADWNRHFDQLYDFTVDELKEIAEQYISSRELDRVNDVGDLVEMLQKNEEYLKDNDLA